MKPLQQVFLLLLFIMITPQALRAQFLCITNADNTITITEYTGNGGDVQIPGTINGLPVTSIAISAFKESDLTSVIIPEGVIEIGTNAFCASGLLTNVGLPNSLVRIGLFQ